MSIDVPMDRFGRCAKLAWEHARDVAADFDPQARDPMGVTTTHLLLGVVREPDCAGGLILRRLGADLSLIDDQGMFVLRHGRRTEGLTVEALEWEGVTHTRSAARALELCIEEANLTSETFPVGTEHLLLSILRQRECAGAKLLDYFGIGEQQVRATRDGIWHVLRLAE